MLKVHKRKKSQYKDFSFKRKVTGKYWTNPKTGIRQYDKFTDHYWKVFEAKKRFDTDNWDMTVSKILSGKNVEGVLCIMKIRNNKSDEIIFVSDFITKNLLYRIHNVNNKNIYDHIAEKIRLGDTDIPDFTLLQCYMKIVYAKA